MKHKWEQDTATIARCACGALRQIVARPPRTRSVNSSRKRPEYKAQGSDAWSEALPPCTRAPDRLTVERERQGRARP